ncbi:thioredoxin family protein [Desulfurispirillum indicum]|uniref:Redox-active disulfide protein 2 n=1 Tax=Desulfurispirillum indicum (strain ATCC BAA-1389 / DSM 22839 / S5) TaxID=653733 RepID=E6W751_DESIS|nr:thioredoxin family protein [Desulfurispirillum indicum]ADU65129.1 redox-active disulfide protein 2 [Desulfurispirillum indicum S5]UCZ57032.1 thioredoxin family protein [Desulfurispirillum indicum]
MKKLQILGTGCAKCRQLTANAQKAIEESGADYELEKITDINEIVKMGVMMTPGVAIDGELKSTGKLLSPADIKKLLV